MHGPAQKQLTSREEEVLAMTARGLTNTEIATLMQLSVHGVKFHLASVYRKLGVANRTEAAVAFTQTTGGTGISGEVAG